MRSRLMYRLPFAVMLVIGVFFIAQHYLSHPAVQQPAAMMRQWRQPLAAVVMFAAAAGVLVLHARRIARRERRFGYSIVTLASMAAMTFFGMAFGIQEGTVFAKWFQYLITPIESTMFALLAFFIASAAFRAFRARSAAATVLLVSAFTVMLGLIPAVENRLPVLGDLTAFLLKYPNTAAKRAILIGVALGAISVGLKTIFGIDRTLLTKGR